MKTIPFLKKKRKKKLFKKKEKNGGIPAKVSSVHTIKNLKKKRLFNVRRLLSELKAPRLKKKRIKKKIHKHKLYVKIVKKKRENVFSKKK